jgi:glutamine synthetase
LPNIRNCVDGIHAMIEPANAKVLIKHGTLPAGEIKARHEILLEHYVKTINIEAKTMLFMARREILPAVMSYEADMADGIGAIKAAGVTPGAQVSLLRTLNNAAEGISAAIDALAEVVGTASAVSHAAEKAAAYRDSVIPAMVALRKVCDGIEPVISDDYWPLPTYADMLFYR